MHLRSNWVAESFNTTPRAPSCNASTIWFFSAAAVSSMTRTGLVPGLLLRSRKALTDLFHLRLRQSPRKWKAFAIVFQGKNPLVTAGAKANQCVASAAVFAHIDQSFLHDADQLPANPLRHVEFLDVGDEPGGDASLPPKTFHSIMQDADKLPRIYVDRLHLLHQ